MRFGTVERMNQTQQAFADYLAARGLSGLGQSNLTIHQESALVKAGGGGGGGDDDNGDDNGDGGNGSGSLRSRRCPSCSANGIFILGTVSGLSLLAAAIFGR